MKLYASEFRVPVALDDAFELVFNDERVLNDVHGEGRWRATPWSPKSPARKISFEMNPAGVPPIVLKVIGNGKMAADVSQRRSDSGSAIKVVNSVRPRVLGAEFVRIRPTFTLRAVPEGTAVGVRCEVHAILPPPMSGAVEDFMRATAAASFEWLRDAVIRRTAP
jgi:hypothetical protein